jgi:hypothetical protein
MEADELIELHEKAHRPVERRIGVTMAVFAAALATATLMGHRLHTDEVVQQTKTADGWAYYQAKNIRAQMYGADATLAELQGGRGAAVASQWKVKAGQEQHDAETIRSDTESLERATEGTARRATLFDASEVFLEIAIVLCSVALLTGSMLFWGISFVGAAIGAAAAIVALLNT